MEPVVVTGLGALTPAGQDVPGTWQRVCSGRSTALTDPLLGGLPAPISCRVQDFDAVSALGRRKAQRTDRFLHLALVAGREALADARLCCSDWDGERVAIVLGCGLGGAATWEEQQDVFKARGHRRMSPLAIPMILSNVAAGTLAMEFQAYGPNLAVSTACASGATAVGTARDLLRAGACDVALAGGTESALTQMCVGGFARMGALSSRACDPQRASRPFDAERDGFVAAEGAGFLVLERERHALARGARPRAYLLGYGASADAYHVTAPDPEGKGAERALVTALRDASVEAGSVGYVSAHGTSTPMNDLVEAEVIARALGTDVPVSSTKGVLGHALGAAGAIEAVLTVLALETGSLPPTANLEQPGTGIDIDVVAGARQQRVDVAVSNSFGFGGQNAVLVFARA